MRSALYEGTVLHHRREPIDHRFSYRVALPLIDLDELAELCALHPLWSSERRNVVTVRRRDYLPGGPALLADAARDAAAARLGYRPTGPVAMLAHPRTWGWLFNPITLFYCFDATGERVEALVGEVTNTPWHERRVYSVGAPGSHRFSKTLHVSPFFSMDMDYELAYSPPGDQLLMRMSALTEGQAVFRAALRLERRQMDRRALSRLVFGYPFMTLRVSAGIYRQAFALWRSGAPFVPHPRRSAQRPGTPEARVPVRSRAATAASPTRRERVPR